MSPVDQANKAAEECPHHGEDNEVSKEYEHPPPCLPGGYSLALWRMLLVQLWQGTTGQKSSLRAGGQRGESKEMQSANIKGIGSSNMKLYKIQFCETEKKQVLPKIKEIHFSDCKMAIPPSNDVLMLNVMRKKTIAGL